VIVQAQIMLVAHLMLNLQ